VGVVMPLGYPSILAAASPGARNLTVPASHRDLERLLAGFNAAYDARRQRVLGGRSPEQVVRERLARDRSLANPGYHPPPDPCVLPKALLVVERAKDASQPDTWYYLGNFEQVPCKNNNLARHLLSG